MPWLIGEYRVDNDMDNALDFDDRSIKSWSYENDRSDNYDLVMDVGSGKRLLKEGDLVIYDERRKVFFRDLDYLPLYKPTKS